MDDTQNSTSMDFLNDELSEILEKYNITLSDDIVPTTYVDLSLEDTEEDVFDVEPVVEPKEKNNSISNKSIRVIKGNSIDLNKVFAIEKIEREHNNKTTYGIKFIFKGKNKYYRIVWFNENVVQRDRTYEQENKIWQQNEK